MTQQILKLASDADEVTPLLIASNGSPITQVNDAAITTEVIAEDEAKPLPMGQIVLLCYARLVEPIAFFSIFPFINQMIFDTGGVKKSDVGFYSGLIESLFSLTQMILMISWGRAADRFGRKPVLVFSLAGVSIAVALFGFSQALWQMFVLRCLAGLFAGTIVTVRTMTSELSTPRTQARAFSFFAFSGNLGIFLGPLIGGALAEPATQYSSHFGGIWFFEKYPYALSTIVVGAVGASASILCAVYLKETLKSKEEGKTTADPPMTTLEILKFPGVSYVLFIYAHTMLLAYAYTAVAPVFQFTPIDLGGYGFSPLLISVFFAIAGASQAIWVLLVFPPLQSRIGTGGVLRSCYVVWPLFFALNPLGNFLRRNNLDAAFWAILGPASVLGSGVAMAFTAVQLAANDIAPSPSTLGTLNALVLTLVSAVRAFTPALFASIYAQSVRSQILGGYLIWLILVVLAVIALIAMRWFPERAEGKLKPKSSSPLGEE